MRTLSLVLAGGVAALMIGVVFVIWYEARPASGFVTFCAALYWVRFWFDVAGRR